MNVANPDVFAKAQQEILGEDHACPMISYHPMKVSKAWKLYAKAKGVPFEEANAVSENIHRYEEAVKTADEDSKDDIDVMDYISPQYHEIFRKSADYRGIIDSWSIAPCGYLLYDGSIRRQFGLVRINDHICCAIDGHWAEEGHFLKNDNLKVSIVALINQAYTRIGMKVPTVTELIAMCPPDDPAWEVYRKGCTMGVNQVERKGTAARCSNYHPTNISELCAFIAAIRPGFASMYSTFESRKPFEYGVKAFDDILKTDELPFAFCLYQEQEMAALHYAGIPMSDCYAAIKDIAKKRAEKVYAYKEKFIAGFTSAIMTDEGRPEDEAKQIAEKLWTIIEDSARYSFNACVDSDTVIRKMATGGRWQPTVEEMYMIRNFPEYALKTGHSNLRKKYISKGYGTALSMCQDGRIRRNEIKDIRPAGEREVFRLVTETGRIITCTANHKFPTPDGDKRLDELSVNSEIYVSGTYEKCTKKYAFTNGDFQSNVPTKGQKGFQTNVNGCTVRYYAFRQEAIDSAQPCEICGKAYSDDSRFEVHHADGDRANNDPSNFMWLCCSCHKRIEYERGRTKIFEKGLPTETECIARIEPAGTRRTYNVEMEAPNHNFLTDSGIVTSNSHSYCVSCDSLYIAWIKAHYPLETYETLLKFYDSRGEKDKMADAKAEAKRYFGIKFPPMRYGQDNRAISSNPETNEITESISAIKGFSASVGKKLWESAQVSHGSFTDLLYDLDRRGVKAKTEPLIKIDYFSAFGNQRELLRLFAVFNFFKQGEAKEVRREDIDGTVYEPCVRPHATWLTARGEEAKSYKLNDVYAILRDIEAMVLSSGLPDLEDNVKVANYIEIMGQNGYVSGRPEDRPKLYVKEVFPVRRKSDGKQFGYSILTQSIGSGIESRFTVFSTLYETAPIRKGDLILCTEYERKGQYFNLRGYRHLSGAPA